MSDHPLVRHAGRRQFGRLLEAGIEIHEYTAALLHAKTMVIDGIWATVGSTNLDHRSFRLNDELNVVAYDADVRRPAGAGLRRTTSGTRGGSISRAGATGASGGACSSCWPSRFESNL